MFDYNVIIIIIGESRYDSASQEESAIGDKNGQIGK